MFSCDRSANGVKTARIPFKFLLLKEMPINAVSFSFSLLVEKLQLPSLHHVGFLAHGIKIEDFFQLNRLNLLVVRTFRAPATVTLFNIPNERNLDVSKLKQVLVCRCSFVCSK